MATSKHLRDIPLALNDNGVEVRADQMGDLLVAYERWPKGDWRPLFHGLPGHRCQAEHWGYLLKGVGRLHNADGTVTELKAGQAYHAPPGHTFEVIEDAEMIEFTRPHAAYEADVGIMMGNFETMKRAAKPTTR